LNVVKSDYFRFCLIRQTPQKFIVDQKGNQMKDARGTLIWPNSCCEPQSCDRGARAAVLQTEAANNSRGHTLWSFYYCLFAPHKIRTGAIISTHPVRGASRF